MDFQVRVTAGRGAEPADATADTVGITVSNPRAADTVLETAFTGGHLLHAAVAACVLNDLYREAQAMGLQLDHVEVRAGGGFAGEPVTSTGITYTVEVDSPEPEDRIAQLVARVDAVAEIPSALRAGIDVRRAVAATA